MIASLPINKQCGRTSGIESGLIKGRETAESGKPEGRVSKPSDAVIAASGRSRRGKRETPFRSIASDLSWAKERTMNEESIKEETPYDSAANATQGCR